MFASVQTWAKVTSHEIETLAFIAAIFLGVLVFIALVIWFIFAMKKWAQNKYLKNREELFASEKPIVHAWVRSRDLRDVSSGLDVQNGPGKLELKDGNLIFHSKRLKKPAWILPAETVYVGPAAQLKPAIYLFNEQIGHLIIFLSFKSIYMFRGSRNTDWLAENELADDWVKLIFRAGGHPLPEEFQIRRSRSPFA